MKRFLFVVFIFSLYMFAQEQLQNGGMELWTGGMPDYWTKTSGVTVSQEGTIVHSGSYSAKIVKTSTATERIEQHIKVDPNTQYNFEFYVYTDRHIRARLWLRWMNASNAQIYADSSNYSSVANAYTWQYINVSKISPSTAESLQYQIRFYNVAWGDSITSATCYVDDASCIKPGANQYPEIQNIILNPYAPYPDNPVIISANIFDPDGSIAADTLYYNVNGGPYNGLIHNFVNGNTYYFTIPGFPEPSRVNYYFVAVDNQGAKTISPTKTYKVYYPTNDTLKNRGMESWINPNTPEYWTIENASFVTATQSTDYVLEGSYSCKLSRIQVGNFGILQKVKVNPRDTVVVTSHIYDNDPDVSGRMWFRRRLWDGTATNVFSSYTVDSDQWQQFAETLILPDETDTLEILFRVYTQFGTTGDSLGDIYIDKINLRSISGIPENKEDLKFDTYIITNGLFSYNSGKNNVFAKIYDISGRIMDEKFFVDGIVKFDLKDKKNGVYFVRIEEKFIRIININTK